MNLVSMACAMMCTRLKQEDATHDSVRGKTNNLHRKRDYSIVSNSGVRSPLLLVHRQPVFSRIPRHGVANVHGTE
jgi:hypothetical protein